MKYIKPSLILAFLYLASPLVWAEAQLLGEKSSIRFVSVKNAAVAEVHRFPVMKGRLSDEGRAEISISLADVATMIPIRDERMRELFFEVATFPFASIDADVDLEKVNALKNGQYAVMEVLFELDLHGTTQMMKTDVEVSRMGKELHVSTLQPLVINAGSFGLVEGVERLREVAGLQNISTAVPVTATLVFAYE